jgi:prepilin-type N-terminal cleavage/methylation domain-containing protein
VRSLIRHNGPARRGLSIVEMLIALAISALLLAAVAAAYNASADAVETNDRFFRATQAARVTMNQVLTEIRRAESVLCAPGSDSIIVTRPPAGRLPDEQSREFRYHADTRKVTLQIFYRNGAGATWTSPAYSMASNVESAMFGPADLVNGVETRIPIALDVKIAANTVRLSGSSTPRRLTLGA